MDTSLVVLLCVFTFSVILSVGVAAWVWAGARTLLSSVLESCRQLEACVKQRTSMADEVAALREPLTMAAARSAILIEEVQKATREMAGNLATVPKMIEAMAEIAKREIEILEQVKSTAQSLYSALYSKDPKRATFRPTDPAVADREYEIQELMQEQGMSRAAAEEQALHDRRLEGFTVSR